MTDGRRRDASRDLGSIRGLEICAILEGRAGLSGTW